MASYETSGKNKYFQYIGINSEQNLLMDLNREVISIHGVELYFLPTNFENVDALFGEDRIVTLNTAWKIVAYPNNASDPFQGSALFSKFGYQNTQTISLVISVKEWQEVTATTRPLEGMIVYIPQWDTFGASDFLKVTFVDKTDANGWFQLGKHLVFTLECEKWKYSSETWNTGIPEIDDQLEEFSNDVAVNPNLEHDIQQQNTVIETIADSLIDFSESNPFGEP